MPSPSPLLHATARHEAGHAIIAELLFASMRGITKPVIRQVEAFPDGTGGVRYVAGPDVPATLKPRLCIAHTHSRLRTGSPVIWDAVCDFRIASSQDTYNHPRSGLHEKTLAIVARDILSACGQSADALFDVGILYDWLTVYEAVPPPGYNPAYGDGGHAPAGYADYADASYFVGSLLAYAGYTDRRAIAADLLVVLAGPAAEGVDIQAHAATSDLFISTALFDALHAVDDFYVSTEVQDATRTKILQITADVLNHPQIKQTRDALEALLIANNIISGDPYAAWATAVRGLAADFPDVQYVLNYALDTAETLLIPA